MKRPDYVIIGPDPLRTDVANPGGQLTATTGLLQFAEESGLELAFVDTLQGSFPVPSLPLRIARLLRRQLQVFGYSTLRRPRKGVLVFSAGPGSFLDRAISVMIMRLFGVDALMCLRSGRLLPYLGVTSPLGRLISGLARLQPRLIVQGRNWIPDLAQAGVDPSRVRVVANWLSPTKPRALQPRRVPEGRHVRFVYVGWLVVEKGMRELLMACEILVASGEAFHLTIVGGGTLYDELAQRIMHSDLENHVTMTGWVAQPDVSGQLDAADVFVLPTYYEGFPNALVEAFALGLPAISTPVGAIPDSLVDGENGFLASPRDPKALSDAMRRYIHNPELVAQHSVEALRTVKEKHDFHTNCARLFAAVER